MELALDLQGLAEWVFKLEGVFGGAVASTFYIVKYS